MLIKCLWDNGPEQAETGALSPSFIVLKILVDNYYYYLINYYKAAPCTWSKKGSDHFVSYIYM
jgi:hypothetical protein